MRLRALALGVAAAGMLAIPQMAEAAWGGATGSVNMRTCASVRCAKITVIPRGASVWVLGATGGWYHLRYNGRQGFASGRYIAVGRPPVVHPRIHITPPPPFGYWQYPRWNPRYGAWYDGRRWYYNGRWYGNPSGFYFGFRFGN